MQPCGIGILLIFNFIQLFYMPHVHSFSLNERIDSIKQIDDQLLYLEHSISYTRSKMECIKTKNYWSSI